MVLNPSSGNSCKRVYPHIFAGNSNISLILGSGLVSRNMQMAVHSVFARVMTGHRFNWYVNAYQ